MSVNFANSRAEFAIDFGTANLRVIHRDDGVIFDEPSLCCLADGEWGPALVAAGLPASEMSERTPSGLRVRRPLKRGVLQDIGSATQLLCYAVPKVRRRQLFGTQRVIIGLPADATQAERRAMLTAAHDAGLNPLDLIPEPLAAAIGAGLAVREPRATMLVECGAGTTEVAVLSLGGICQTRALRGGGDEMDQAIIDHLHFHHKLLVGRRSAERIKRALETVPVSANGKCSLIEVKGRSLVSGLPTSLRIPSAEIAGVAEKHAQHIVDLMREVLGATTPELSDDIHTHGIFLTGGGAALPAIRAMIEAQTGLGVTLADTPDQCVARGLLQILRGEQIN